MFKINLKNMSETNRKTTILTLVGALVAIVLIVFLAITTSDMESSVSSKGSKKIINEFNEKFESDKRTVIYYASPSCSYCSLQTPILETIASDYNMDYYYLDTSAITATQRKTVMKKLGMDTHSTPTTVVVENGKVIDTLVGYTPGTKYVEFLKNAKMLPKDAVYSAEQYITFIDSGEYNKLISNTGVTNIIVVGQTTCSHCIAIKPALNSVAKEFNLTINYLNLTDMSENQSSSFFESLKTIGYNDDDFVSDGSFGTPTILIVRDGKVTNYISGEKTTSQLIKEFKKIGLIAE